MSHVRRRDGLLHPAKGDREKGNAFGSHKYAGKSTLRYELGVDILAGKLVWIQGPYPAGKWPDIKIFNSVLANLFEPSERVESDDGYRGHADKVKCPKNAANPSRTSRCRVASGRVTRRSMGG
jgi:hypothetical protein